MVKGLGVDIVEIERIDGLIVKYGEQFLGKIFTPAEIQYCSRMAFPALHFSGRWAAKEAFYKALPSECQKVSSWKSVEILPQSGRPVVTVLSDELRHAMDSQGVVQCLLTISHEKKNSVAVVVLA